MKILRCDLCPVEKAFFVPAPVDEAGLALMSAHMESEHPVTE